MRKFMNIDSSRFPIVVARTESFTPTAQEFRQMQLDFENFALSHSNFIAVIDLTQLAFLPSEFRISQAKWSKEKDPMFAQQKLRLAFCTPSLIGQMMLKGIFLISKPAVPHTVVSSIDQGIAWGMKQLA